MLTITPRARACPGEYRCWVVLAAGTLIVFATLGMRHAFGFFLDPVTRDLPVLGRAGFGLAVAIQNLVWGISQPIAGMIADRHGAGRVLGAGGLAYAMGLFLASGSSGPVSFHLGFGILLGFGLGCTTYGVILGAVGRAFPPERRTGALGIASVGGAAGMFCSVPVTIGLIDHLGWNDALVVLATLAFAVCAAAPFLAGRSRHPDSPRSPIDALRNALSHRGYVLLTLGFFVCGFQLAFFVTHLPAYLLDRHAPIWLGGAALTLIGLTNVLGTFASGLLGDLIGKTRLLALIYTARAAITLWLLLMPMSPTTVIVFSALMGLTWLATVPLTTAVVAQIFGVSFIGTLIGIVFLMHQVGSFLGAWLGGLSFALTGSYDATWWGVIVLGVVAAIIHLMIDERPHEDALRVEGETHAA